MNSFDNNEQEEYHFNVFCYDWRAVKNLQINHTSYWNNNEHYESFYFVLVVYLGRALAVVPAKDNDSFGQNMFLKFHAI